MSERNYLLERYLTWKSLQENPRLDVLTFKIFREIEKHVLPIDARQDDVLRCIRDVLREEAHDA